MKRIFLVALCGWASGAAADCVTAADLEGRGIQVVYERGTTEIFRRAANGHVDVRGTETDGYTYRYLLGHGLHLLEDVGTENGVDRPDDLISFVYGEGNAAMPVPAPGVYWQGEVQVVQKSGTTSERQEHVFGQPQVLEVEGCPYETFVVQSAYSDDSGVFFREEITYFSELGFGAVLTVIDGGEPPSTYRIVQMNKVP